MTNENAVEIIGFQEEKVHTNLLAWAATSSEFDGPALKDLLREFMPAQAPVEQLAISAAPEYSRKRSRRIDLVLCGRDESGRDWYSVIECKTDSDIRLKQLQGTERDFLGWNPKADGRTRFVILAVGAGECTYETVARPRDGSTEQIANWTFVGCERLRDLLRPIAGESDSELLLQWVEALTAEVERSQNIAEAFQTTREERRQAGYRGGFSDYYRYYAHLRKLLNPSDPGRWQIYSGSHNPVLNDSGSWVKHAAEGGEFPTYFEFNHDSLYYKAAFWGSYKRPGNWGERRAEFIAGCTGGTRAANRSGSSASLYRWTFDFSQQSADQVAAAARQHIASTQRALKLRVTV